MQSSDVRTDDPQPNEVDEEVENIHHVHMQHPRKTPRDRWHRHVLHIHAVLAHDDAREGVEAMGAEVQH